MASHRFQNALEGHWRIMYDNYRSGLIHGGLAQLARAPALHAGGHRFDSDILSPIFSRK